MEQVRRVERQVINKKPVKLTQFNAQLTLTLHIIGQYLVSKSLQNNHPEDKLIQYSSSIVDDIYSLALGARPIPRDLIRQLTLNNYTKTHPLFKLKEAIDQFNYQLVIELIDKYRSEDKN
jgi:hypothetical protein